MLKSLQKDLQHRLMFQKMEYKRLLYKSLLHDRSLSQEQRFAFCQKLHQLPRQSALVKVRNRCVLSGRARGVLRFFKLSRICLRELVASGTLDGVTKASW